MRSSSMEVQWSFLVLHIHVNIHIHTEMFIFRWKSLHVALHTEACSRSIFCESTQSVAPIHTEVLHFPMEILTSCWDLAVGAAVVRLAVGAAGRWCGRPLLRLAVGAADRWCGRCCGWPLVRLAVGAAGRWCGWPLVRLAPAAADRWCGWSLVRLAVAAAGRCFGWPLVRLAVGVASRGCGVWGATLQKCETVTKNRPLKGPMRNATRNPSIL